MMSENKSAFLVSEMLIKKFGEEKIIGLLTDEYFIEKTRGEERPTGTYTRRLKNGDPLLDYDWGTDSKKLRRLPPRLLLEALDDAANEMSYSNWHGDKFERIEEIVIRYCEIKKVPIEMTIIEEDEDNP